MQRKFNYGGATITLHRQRNADLLDGELVLAILMEGVDTGNQRRYQHRYHKAARYADTLVSIDAIDGDPGFALPAADAPEEDLRAGFEAWLNESGFYLAWVVAFRAANAPVGDVDTSPVADPKGTTDPT